MLFFIFLILIGLIAGFLSGLLGIGGGLIFTPILFYLFIKSGVANPVSFTIATSLFCIILVSASSTFKHLHQKNFNAKEGIILGLFGAFGTTIGKQITTSSYYSVKEFSLLFTCVLVYSAYSFLRKPRVNKGVDLVEKPLKLWDGLLVGGLGGLIAALAGLGGGIIMVPLLNLVYHKPFHLTVSISSFAILILSIVAVILFSVSSTSSSAITFYQLGFVDFGTGFPLALGGMIGAIKGAKMSMTVNKQFLQKLFAIVAIIEAIRLIYTQFLS